MSQDTSQQGSDARCCGHDRRGVEAGAPRPGRRAPRRSPAGSSGSRRGFQQAYSDTFQPLGLNDGDYGVLAPLRRAGEPYTLTPTELARHRMMTSGGMTAALDRLEQKGFIDRLPNPADRRGEHRASHRRRPNDHRRGHEPARADRRAAHRGARTGRTTPARSPTSQDSSAPSRSRPPATALLEANSIRCGRRLGGGKAGAWGRSPCTRRFGARPGCRPVREGTRHGPRRGGAKEVRRPHLDVKRSRRSSSSRSTSSTISATWSTFVPVRSPAAMSIKKVGLMRIDTNGTSPRRHS